MRWERPSVGSPGRCCSVSSSSTGDRGLVAIVVPHRCRGDGGRRSRGDLFGVKAEGANLEDLAPPLSAADEHTAGSAESAESETDDSERRARDARIAARAERQRVGQSGARRYRPGPSAGWNAAWREPPSPGASETALDHEIETIARAVAEHEPMTVRDLHRAVGARYWGPGEFRKAVREALAENRIARAAARPPGCACTRGSTAGVTAVPGVRSPADVPRRWAHDAMGMRAVRTGCRRKGIWHPGRGARVRRRVQQA